MNISHITTVDEIISFIKSTETCTFAASKSKQEIYEWLNNLLSRLPYRRLKRKEKRITKDFIKKVTGYSDIQIKRLISKHKQGKLKWLKWQKSCFSAVYTHEDIDFLHQVDSVHRLSGKATKKILQREFEVFGKEEYRKLANISVSHIYNLRHKVTYQRMGKVFTETRSTAISIGKRQKPRPHGKPGYLRVDSVHQGDKGRLKGLYFINIVDEVTQSEFVFCTPFISERYMKPIFETLMKLCPFRIYNFHSDNGSEYINYMVADILNRLHIKQTKSRPRKHNDNALVESKNGSIIRKHFGYSYIPATEANAHIINTFCINFLNPYINYHRPCAYATTITDKKGKEKKIYKTEDYQIPYEKLKGLSNAKQYLKRGMTFGDLDRIAYTESDTECAKKMKKEKEKMLLKLNLQ